MQKEVDAKLNNIKSNEMIINLMTQKKHEIKDNLLRLKDTISKKKKELELEQTQILLEKTDENTLLQVISNIRKNTFSHVFEYNLA